MSYMQVPRDVPGIDAAYLAMDTEEGVEVVWNEVRYSHRRMVKGSRVSCWPVCPSISLSVCLSVHLSVGLSVCPSVCLFVHISGSLSVHQPLCQFICPSYNLCLLVGFCMVMLMTSVTS